MTTLPSPHRMYQYLETHHVPDVLLAMLATLTTSVLAAFTMLGDSAPGSSQDELQLLLVPLIGSLVGTTGMILLSPTREPRRIIAGRSIIGVTVGTASPVVTGFVSEWGATMAKHPVALLLAGLVVSMVAYALSRSIANVIWKRSDNIAESVIDAGETLIPKSGVSPRAAHELDSLDDDGPPSAPPSDTMRTARRRGSK